MNFVIESTSSYLPVFEKVAQGVKYLTTVLKILGSYPLFISFVKLSLKYWPCLVESSPRSQKFKMQNHFFVFKCPQKRSTFLFLTEIVFWPCILLTVEFLQSKRFQGYNRFQLKLGGNLSHDIERIKLCRSILGPNDVLIGDANTGEGI